MTQERILSIMRTDFLTLDPTTPIRRAAALLVQSRAAAAPVIDDDDCLVGILTQKDCFRPALHASYYREWSGCVADQMSRSVVSVETGDALIVVAELFLALPHRVFPVRDGTRVAGLIHRSDILARLIRLG
ncbi:MAG: CBS domain-containing protein [Paracoccaceae bacterium]